MDKFIRILCALVMACAIVGPGSVVTVSAQTLVAQAAQGSSVTGTITDTSGAPVAGATVTVKGQQTYTAATDANGAFSIGNVTPGVYTVTVAKTGFNTITENTFVVVAGSPQNITAQMQQINFSSLRTIASVRSTGRGTFNVTPASVNVISAQTFIDQAQPQVMKVLDQTPGVVASYPQTSANGAVAGAITFPNIRGALSFESASLIDGHPIRNLSRWLVPVII